MDVLAKTRDLAETNSEAADLLPSMLSERMIEDLTSCLDSTVEVLRLIVSLTTTWIMPDGTLPGPPSLI